MRTEKIVQSDDETIVCSIFELAGNYHFDKGCNNSINVSHAKNQKSAGNMSKGKHDRIVFLLHF